MDNGFASGTNWALFGGMFGALVGFGVLYNHLMAWLERTGRLEGFVSLFVAGGVIITLAMAWPLIGLQNALIVLALFVPAGLPMMVGSMWRYIEARRSHQDESRAARGAQR
jgi:hypothetical protein